jgi:hypothetical protein
VVPKTVMEFGEIRPIQLGPLERCRANIQFLHYAV